MKKQAPILQRKQKENTVNKKAIIWVSSIIAAFIILMAVLLIVNG
jgi:hypothetical protein